MSDLFGATASLAFDLLVRTVPVVVLGVFAAEVLIALRITDTIARAARPVTSFAHLPGVCGTSFMMAFLSSHAADAMLMDHLHNGRIGRRELLIAALMNSFPGVVMHWRYLLPVYVPLLGTVGLAYFIILMAIGLAKTGIVMVAGHFLLPAPEGQDTALPLAVGGRGSGWEVLDAAWQSAKRTLRRILPIMIPTLIIVAFLIELGVFDAISSYLSDISTYFPVPVGGLSIIAAKFGSFVAAASVASALLVAGEITGREVIITLLVGNLLSSFVLALRWFGSFYIAIFGPRLGTEIMIYSTVLRDGITLVVIFLLAWVWL
ncbi:nucleoside recognition protein [Methanoculleus taiwanensis]|uniref:Nucleoside recognition protein n=1 Tax=Methanoculleus taiwanensis TaxID=1550565 RepID=A0A498H343_9EURY|nr:nucleoside recognition protein [Methanoculleus taiwanensis]RXE56917.1 nucleoside recognition protein [Methanoculleus taiwanensis]